MGLFSALMSNSGAVSQDELRKNYGTLLTDNEAIEMGFKFEGSADWLFFINLN